MTHLSVHSVNCDHCDYNCHVVAMVPAVNQSDSSFPPMSTNKIQTCWKSSDESADKKVGRLYVRWQIFVGQYCRPSKISPWPIFSFVCHRLNLGCSIKSHQQLHYSNQLSEIRCQIVLPGDNVSNICIISHPSIFARNCPSWIDTFYIWPFRLRSNFHHFTELLHRSNLTPHQTFMQFMSNTKLYSNYLSSNFLKSPPQSVKQSSMHTKMITTEWWERTPTD